MKRFPFTVFVVATLSLGACATTNQAVAREKAATKLTCDEVTAAIRYGTSIPGPSSPLNKAEIVKNAKLSGNPTLISESLALGGLEPRAFEPQMPDSQNRTQDPNLIPLLRTCDSLGLGATF